ncbi:hypothetical protein RJT34_22649 [Clitoria ternatea]|uniref:Uncharacterized protein n=1 Tax=Clitoria ternatea TaxID=43366 RepID=A0AAN9FJP6_CLITE
MYSRILTFDKDYQESTLLNKVSRSLRKKEKGISCIKTLNTLTVLNLTVYVLCLVCDSLNPPLSLYLSLSRSKTSNSKTILERLAPCASTEPSDSARGLLGFVESAAIPRTLGFCFTCTVRLSFGGLN